MASKSGIRIVDDCNAARFKKLRITGALCTIAVVGFSLAAHRIFGQNQASHF